MKRQLLILIIVALVPLGAAAQTDAVDITAAFIRGGAVIEGLKVFQISDVVLILGRTNDAKKAERAGRIATTLGYQRVANLVVIRDDATDDAAIVYTGQRQLELERELEGCRFRVESNRGVIRLTGSVRSNLQSDLAIAILGRIDGVKSVHPELVLR